MRRLVLPLAALVAVLIPAVPAPAASLPVNQRFVDAERKLSLLTRAGGKGYLTGRTRCGRMSDQRVSLRRGKVTSLKGARLRVSGTIPTRSRVVLRIRRGKACSVSLTLRRNTRPE